MDDKDTASYQHKRRMAIENAAYKVLADKGYKAASMLAIAREAKASNETLYNWYGNKQKLFGSLVEANTRELRVRLASQTEPLIDMPIDRALTILGGLLLEVVTGERAIALNRAAAGDVHDTATLGKTIAQAGRQTIVPLVANLFEAARASRKLTFNDDDQIAEIWVSLLIGDLQIQRVIGVLPPLTHKQMQARAEQAASLIARLFAE